MTTQTRECQRESASEREFLVRLRRASLRIVIVCVCVCVFVGESPPHQRSQMNESERRASFRLADERTKMNAPR